MTDWNDPEQVRAYHREYRRKNRERLNARQRERYASSPEYRQTLATSQRTYLTTERGRERREQSKDAFYKRNPGYNQEYAQTHSLKAVKRSRAWRDNNPEAYREMMRIAQQRKRAVKRRAFVEDVDPLMVLEIDDGVCGLCGEDVDPFDFHIDHIIPLARGGEHSYANTQPSHPRCNVKKGASL